MQKQSQPDADPNSPSATPPDPSPDAPITEDLALAQLKNHDLPAAVIETICQDSTAMKSRKVHLAVASHSRTPRRVALRLIRDLYTFELAKFALLTAVPADLRRVADELLLSRLSSITLGERISMARRCSAQVASALLLDKENRVWQTALENPRLTESELARALLRAGGSLAFVEAVSHHGKWSPRPEIRIALLRNAHTPLARAIEFARRMPPAHLRDILHTSRLPETIKAYLRKEKETR